MKLAPTLGTRTPTSVAYRAIGVALAVFLAFHLTATQLCAAARSTSSRKSTAAKLVVSPSQRVDVNHATLDELKTLPGIENALAAKIVKNRPYANKTQLSSKGVIPAATYKRIRALIIAKQ
jgi:competence protein ComEA